ncbi:MAG: hypothetical protein K2L22_11740 [Muribaculaceae bacterium]|nr:hypothetical protein [Muribaculaceae bacterium]
MRNSTLFALGLSFVMAMPVAAKTISPVKLINEAKARVFCAEAGVKDKGAKTEAKQADGNSQQQDKLMKISEMAKKMKPGTTKTYGWSRNMWVPEDTYTYTYDASGNVIVELSKEEKGGYSRTVSEYNANNKVTFRENKVSSDGVNYEDNSKSEFEYDPILTSLITKRTEWMWLEIGSQYEWKPVGNTYERTVTRDEAGNITSVVVAVLFNGEYDPTQKLDITYGEDGKATTISEQILGYNGKEYYWEQGVRISNIVWDKTDGQIYNPDDLFIGNNRIGAARYEDPDGLDMNVSVEYADDSEAFTATMTMTMEGMTVTATSEYTPLENDGYISVGTTYFMGEEMYSTREEYRYDDWGLMTLYYEGETEDGETYSKSSVGEVEYDEEGKPITYTISERYPDDRTGEEVIEYVIRAEYSDYVDVTAGVGAAMIREDAEGRCFDLQGMPVAKPAKGQIVVTESGAKIKY